MHRRGSQSAASHGEKCKYGVGKQQSRQGLPAVKTSPFLSGSASLETRKRRSKRTWGEDRSEGQTQATQADRPATVPSSPTAADLANTRPSFEWNDTRWRFLSASLLRVTSLPHSPFPSLLSSAPLDACSHFWRCLRLIRTECAHRAIPEGRTRPTPKMSLSVKHLNGDSTFLLTFSPTHPRHTQPGPSSPAGTFTILLDPWLSGDSTVFHPKFALSKHTIPACINHLSDLSPPDVIIVSQDKPDHCHEETLRQLDSALPHTVILAHPAAAKRIRAWKYFDPNKVHALPMFAEKKPQSLVRFHLPGPTLDASPGEVTVALIAPKRDLTGLHNAIGITYCAPSFSNRISLPISTLQRPQSSHVQRPQSNSPAFDLSVQQRSPSNSSAFDLPIQQYPFLENLPPSPPDTPCSYGAGSPTSLASPVSDNFFPRTATSSVSSAPSITQSIYTPFRPKALSVIYSPHGITYPILVPYVTSHLVSKAALPLTLLLHSFDRVQNPWYLGGNISAGVPGGLGIAQSLLAKFWISAHDEEKESSGLSIKRIVTSKYTVEEVKALAEEGRKGGKAGVDVRKLGCGEEVVLMP